MAIPARVGVEEKRWRRDVAERDRARDRALRKLADPTNSGGVVVVWEGEGGRPQPRTLAVQPGVADDLPSLISSLAAEIGWPGVPQVEERVKQAVAVWARVWQVRDAADLRLVLYWDAAGQFHAAASLRRLDGTDTPLLDTAGVVELLDRTAVEPQSSQSPHGLLLAGNRAMDTGEYAVAREAYQRALKDLPRHPEAHRNLALALARLSEWEAAANAMRAAWKLAPDDREIRADNLAVETDAGVEAVRRGDPACAAEHFLRILEQWPDEPTALANLGNIRLREGRLPEARAIYRRFLRYHPNHPAAETIKLTLAEMGDEGRRILNKRWSQNSQSGRVRGAARI